MNLDEAIRNHEKKAQDNLDEAFILSKERDDGNEGDAYYNEEISACVECAKDHEQLAEWLKELKAYKECPYIQDECLCCGGCEGKNVWSGGEKDGE